MIFIKTRITYININIYEKEIKDLYAKTFGSFINDNDLNRFIKTNFLVFIDKGKIVGLIRYKQLTDEDDKYNKLFGMSNTIFLSDMLSVRKGVGKYMIKDLLSSIDTIDGLEAVITVPWKDSLIEYYNQFGFKESRPKDKTYPKVVMCKKIPITKEDNENS